MKKIAYMAVLICAAAAACAAPDKPAVDETAGQATEQVEPAAQPTTAPEVKPPAKKAKYTKEDARKLLKFVDDSMYPKAYISTMDMNTYRSGRKPLEFSYLIHSKGMGDTMKALMEITSPARDKGKKILLTQNNLWMYMPNVSRPIRLSRKQSFMGSTFSNEDLADSTWEDDYEPEITEEKDGKVLLVMKAKRADVAYDRIDMWVEKARKVPVSGTYYGLSGKAIKKIYFSNVKEIAGLLRPLNMKMEDLLEEGSYTEVKMTSLKAVDSIPDYMFDQTQLGR